MSTLLISEDDFDSEVLGDRDPLVSIPAGFPSMHARYQETPSRMVDEPREIATDAAVQLGEATKAAWRGRILRLLDDAAVDRDHAESFDDLP